MLIIPDNLIVKYMPLLFNPGTLRNNKSKTNFRLSNEELVEAFFLHVHVSNDFQNENSYISFMHRNENNCFLSNSYKNLEVSVLSSLFSQDTTDLDSEINRRKELVAQRGDTLQPFVIGVGSEIEKLTSIYVYIDGTKYLMESSLKAMDVCFKSIQVLNANYSSTTQQLWNFIQRYIYKIHTAYDDRSSSQEEVAVDLCIAEPDLK